MARGAGGSPGCCSPEEGEGRASRCSLLKDMQLCTGGYGAPLAISSPTPLSGASQTVGMATSQEGVCPPGPPSYTGTDSGGPLIPPHFTDNKLEAQRPKSCQRPNGKSITLTVGFEGKVFTSRTPAFSEGRRLGTMVSDSAGMVPLLPAPACLQHWLQGVTTSHMLPFPLPSALLHRDRGSWGQEEEPSEQPCSQPFAWGSVFPRPSFSSPLGCPRPWTAGG